jgi:hypothetical protein
LIELITDDGKKMENTFDAIEAVAVTAYQL